ncbi:hypothetical protein HHK36_022772 [Tetracentron sinense]|uniref:Uncharacterized protein n=1 Tax=Tetracentron sinense TaxID=13715 RepID=A0A834YSK3_TETSI|nr:hypothetical protein HHK36_022772 [Tetracentron sinense]
MKSMLVGLRIVSSRAFASLSVGSDIVSAAPHVSLQKARSWDEGVSSKTNKLSSLGSLKVSFFLSCFFLKKNSHFLWFVLVFVAVYWIIEFNGDFDGSFHKSLDLGLDLSAALLGPRSQRWSAYVVDGKVKVLNIESTV